MCFSGGSAHNVGLSALSIKDPDCSGFLYKRGQHIKTWKKRYCILKSNQLFYYGAMSERTALGVMDLCGYQVSTDTDKKSVGKYHFTALPPFEGMRTFYFYAESEGERIRYIMYPSSKFMSTVQIIAGGLKH